MNKTIYIRDEDDAMWQKAKKLSGRKVSQIIVKLLTEWVKDKEHDTCPVCGNVPAPEDPKCQPQS